MGEELFTILFILFFILASVLDAVGRRRKKKRRIEQMEREEGESRGGVAPDAKEDERPRETAETMVPEDLWAILTGQDPSARPEEDEEVPSAAEPPREPHIPTPVPDDRMSSPETRAARREPQEEEPPETRRTARWMEGTVGRGESDRWAESMDEPWDDLEDITAGDLTEPGGAPAGPDAPARPLPPPPGRRRPRARSAYVDLLTRGNVEDLRKAMVLREVLDRPVGFRERVGPDWE